MMTPNPRPSRAQNIPGGTRAPACPSRRPRRLSPAVVFLAAALFLSAVFPAAAQNKAVADLFPDPVVATGKGFEIKSSTVEDSFNSEKTLVAEQQHVAIPESDRLRVESDILQHLIVNKILVEKATEEEKAKVRDLVDKYLDGLRKAAPSAELFESQVKASGKTLEQIKAGYFEKELARAVLIRELVPTNAISDAAVKKFYEDPDNATNFIVPELVRVTHILISVLDPVTQQTISPAQRREKEKLAEEVKARAEKGEDFAALVKKYSDDNSTKDKGGEITFARHTLPLSLEGFEAASFTLKTNQISDLVESPYGYHIIKLLEKIPPAKRPFDQVSLGIKDYLGSAEINKRLPAYLTKIFADYDVKISFSGYAPSPIQPPSTNAPPSAAPRP